MIVLSDLDGVGADWDEGFDGDIINNWSHVPGIPLKHERKSFNFYDGQPQDVVDAIRAIMDRPRFYAELAPIEGWVDAMHGIKEAGHEVFIVTSPWLTNPTCAQDKFDWVALHLGEDWRERVIITKDKTLVHGDILVDDKPEIHGCRIPSWEQVLFDQPYNQHVFKHRLMNWSEWPEMLARKSFEQLIEGNGSDPVSPVIQHRRRAGR